MPKPFVSYAQNREDVMLWRALSHVQDGFYIDVGAASPDELSVTRAFYDRGWHGINLEPHPGHFDELTRARPRDVNLAIAVGACSSELTLNVVGDTGLSTLVAEEARRRSTEGWTVSSMVVRVETLDLVWAAHVPREQPVHFLKIDVEGYEEEVLRGIDLRVRRPWVLVVEAMRPTSTEPAHDAWETSVVRTGYSTVYADGLNRYYLAEEHGELAASFAYPPNVFDEYVTAAEWVARARLGSAEARAAAAESELRAMRASRSWRLTAPLRSASSAVRRVRGRARGSAGTRGGK